MFFAALEFSDYIILGVLLAILGGGTAVASRGSANTAATGERLKRIEDKLNLLIDHNGLEYVPRYKERWQRLAEKDQTEEAAKEYSSVNSTSLTDAEDVVQQYLKDMREPA